MTSSELSTRSYMNWGRRFERSSRFIPFSSSISSYRNKNTNSSSAAPKQEVEFTRLEAELSSREDRLFVRALEFSDGQCNSDSEREIPQVSKEHNQTKKRDEHQDIIADALGCKNEYKVINFKSPTKTKSTSSFPGKDDSMLSIAGPLLSDAPAKNIAHLLGQEDSIRDHSNYSLPQKPVKILTANSILQAPGLRNDFYSNLVSWSKKSNKIAVGLGIHAYLWGVDNDVEPIVSDEYDIITAISCSMDEYLLIATAHGKIILVDHTRNRVMHSFLNNAKCVYCFEWFPNSKYFLAGDEFGEVSIFEIVKDKYGITLSVVSSFKCHQQQICGMAINNDTSQVAIGSNDNCCSIWDITTIQSPVLKFILPHNAAVKAIAFCPWTKSLLATGGGSRDRNIRFWHTNSGTLLSSYGTHGQITSLIWSRFKKELVATFGFGDGDKPLIIRVYSYPSMTPLIDVPATPNLRILGTSLSPGCDSICVAANDSTIRIYRLWDKSLQIASSTESSGLSIYGSPLIELQEGMRSNHSTIR